MEIFISRRARFAWVTQNPLRGFCLPGKLDGDSVYAPLRSALNGHPPDVQRPHALGSCIFSKYASWLLLKIVAKRFKACFCLYFFGFAASIWFPDADFFAFPFNKIESFFDNTSAIAHLFPLMILMSPLTSRYSFLSPAPVSKAPWLC